MLKRLIFCLVILQFSFSWALESYNKELTTNLKAQQCLPKDRNIQGYLTNKHQRTYNSLEWKGIKIPAPRMGLVQLLNRFFYSEQGRESFYSKIDIKKAYPGIEKCKHEICIADNIFGKGAGVYYFYFLDKFGFNLSPYATKFYGKDDHYKDRNYFTINELDSIMAALHMLPTTVFKHYNFGTHFKKIARYDDNVIADSALRFYELFSDISRSEQITAVLHEIGHNISDMTAINEHDYSDLWTGLSSWQSETGDPRDMKILDDSKNFVSTYAKSSPAEDFAESFTAYIVNPTFLEKKSPEKYQFMKNEVFKSIEYKTEKCMTRSSTKLEELLEGADSEYISSACFEIFVNSIPSADKLNINKCIILNSSQKESIPLDFDLIADMSNANKQREYRDIVDGLTTMFVNTYLITPLNCKDYPRLAFYDEKFSTFVPDIVSSNSKNFCRWATLPLIKEKKELSDENIRESLQKILKQRVFDI